MSTGHSKNGVRGPVSRQKPREMCDFCLPDTSKMGCATSKVEQNIEKLRKCSTADSKFGPRDLESRTKSPKIGKNVLLCYLRQNSAVSDCGKSQKSTFCP